MFGQGQFRQPPCWNNLSYEAWSALGNEKWEKFKNGETTMVIPDDAYVGDLGDSRFILIQSVAMLSLEPGPFIRDCFWGGALKVFIPRNTGRGDTIRIERVSKSGKSWIATRVKTEAV